MNDDGAVHDAMLLPHTIPEASAADVEFIDPSLVTQRETVVMPELDEADAKPAADDRGEAEEGEMSTPEGVHVRVLKREVLEAARPARQVLFDEE